SEPASWQPPDLASEGQRFPSLALFATQARSASEGQRFPRLRFGLVSASADLGGLRLADHLDDRLKERRQVVGLAAGDGVAVADDLGIDIVGAGVHHVVLDGEEARRLLTLEGLRRAEDPRAVTDGGDHLALLRHRADEAQDALVAAQEVRREAARDDDEVE